MCSVAKGGLFRVLASAEGDPFSFLEFDFLGREVRASVRAVAERLRFGSAATAPIDRAGPDLHDVRGVLRDDDLISHAFPHRDEM
jgi:hypothetical protein